MPNEWAREVPGWACELLTYAVMALTVEEIMNPELFSMAETEAAHNALRYLVTMGISGAPVLARDGRPVGVVSWRDLALAEPDRELREVMSHPPVKIAAAAFIDEAAKTMAQRGCRRLVVVDKDGFMVGVVSSIDVLRGLTGVPATHPDTFPHFDKDTGLVWSDDATLDEAAIAGAPHGPGVLVLVHGGTNRAETIVWTEGVYDVHERLQSIVTRPQRGTLARVMADTKSIRFRVARCDDAAYRTRVIEWLWRVTRDSRKPSDG